MTDWLKVGATVIPVAPGSGHWDWNDATDRARRFDNSYSASSSGGAARDFHFTTPPVTLALASTYRAALQNVAAQLCTGDVMEIPTMCCAELVSETPVRLSVGHRVVLEFALHEVQPKKLLLKYTPGDTITGEAFTRSTVARQFDANGISVNAAIDAKRDAHYIGGIRTILLEGASTNSALWSRDLTNAAWVTASGTGTTTQNATGLDGTLNTATTVADTSAANFFSKAQSIVVPNDTAPHAVSFYVKKDADTTRFPQLLAEITGGTAVNRAIYLNTQTGAFSIALSTGQGTVRVISTPIWWIVEIVLTNNSTGNVTLTGYVYPAAGTVIGVANAAAQGSIVIGQVQFEKTLPFSTSPIFTAGATVTRGADSYSLPFTTPPQEMTVYAKFVEGGTVSTTNARLWAISAGATSPEFIVFVSGGLYYTDHINSGPTEVSTPGVSPVIGNVEELVSRLFGDGSVDSTQSINGGAATSAAQTVANPLATAWAGQLVWLNSAGASGFAGFTAIQSFKIVAGARSLADMRAA